MAQTMMLTMMGKWYLASAKPSHTASITAPMLSPSLMCKTGLNLISKYLNEKGGEKKLGDVMMMKDGNGRGEDLMTSLNESSHTSYMTLVRA